MRVHVVSDCHTDYAENRQWQEELAASAGGSLRSDALIVAGDVSDDLPTLTATLERFKSIYGEVVFVPGNHDLWVRRQERGKYDSLQKLSLLESACARLGVHTAPVRLAGVWLAPVLSWYHASWDREPDVPGARPIQQVMLDFHTCSWGSTPGLSASDDSIAKHFDALNDPAFERMLADIELEEAASGRRPPVISASHFLPLQQLLPEKRMLFYPNLSKACGSDCLAARLAQLRPLAHVFGHTHFSWDATIDGTRYVQWPLGYPHEQRRRRGGGEGWRPLMLYDAAAGQLAPQRDCYWSSHYAMVERRPENVTPAPWVNLK